MKTKLQILSVALLGIIITSCSSSMNMSKSSTNYSDDIYYTPRERVSNIDEVKNYSDLSSSKQDTSKSSIAQLENKYSKILASDSTNIDTTIYKADYDNTFENRLNFRRSCFGISDYSLSFSDDLRWVLTAYSPSLYNIYVMNDQVWAEPRYSASSYFWPYNYFSIGLNFGYGFWNVSPWFYSNYSYPYYGYNNLYVINPYYWGNYYYTNVNYNNSNYYYGPRSGSLNTSNTSPRFRDNSIENQILSSRRRGDLATRGNTSTTTTRTDQGNRNQEIITRGTRSNDFNTTRLRDNSGSTRNTNLTETTRRNNNTYQTPRSTNNDSYIRTGTRNQNLGTNSNTRNTNSSVRDREGVNRNTSPTYNRPSRVDVSSTRERTTNSTNSTSSTRQRESTYSNSGSSSGTRTSSSSNSNTNTNNSNSSGSNSRRR